MHAAERASYLGGHLALWPGRAGPLESLVGASFLWAGKVFASLSTNDDL